MSKCYSATPYTDKETGETVIDLPQELVNELGWTGDTHLHWRIGKDGSVSVSAAQDVIEYTYDRFFTDITILAEQIKASGVKYTHIVGLVRGGLIPAVVLSHKLGLPLRAVQWQTRDKSDHNHIADSVRDEIHTGTPLFVDDLIDSGETASQIFDELGGEVDFAVLYYNIAQSIKPRYFVNTIDRNVDERWIVFWWE